MQQVNVPGVGLLNFPDGMSQQDMAAAIYKNFPQLRPQQTAPQQPTAPQGGRLPLPEDLDPMADEAETMASKATLSGISEGAKRFWGALKQAGADVADLYHTYINPTVNPQTGAGVMPTAGAEATAAENARRAQAAQAAQQQFGPVLGAGQQAVAGATEMGLNALPAVATEGAAGPSTTYLGNDIRQAVLGTLQGLTAFSPTNDKARDAAIAGVGGSAIGLLNPVAAFNASLNHIRNAIQAFGGRSEAAYQAAKAIMGWGTPTAAAAGVEPTIAMRSGAPMARSFEAASFGGQIQDRYANIRDNFLLRFKDVFGLPQQSVESPALDGEYAKALTAAKASINGIRRAASDAYDAGMAEAQRLGQQVEYPPNYKNPVTINVPAPGQGTLQTANMDAYQAAARGARVGAFNFNERLKTIYAQDTDPIGGSQAMDAGWMKAVMAKLQAGNGTLSVQDTAGVLRRLAGIIRNSDNREQVALAGKLMDSFNKDLDLTAEDASGAHPAVQQILSTRAAYRQAMERVEALQQTAAYRFLGVDSPQEVNPSTLLGRFENFAPVKQRQVASYLNDNAPQLLQLMRRKAVQDAVNTATGQLGPASNSEVNPDALLGVLYGPDGVLRHSGLWSPAEQAKMEQFRQAAKVIMNVSPHTASGAGVIVGPAEVAPNIVSHSPIFIARQLSRVLQLSHGADIFTDPTLFDEMMRVRKTSGPAQVVARTALSNYIAKTYGVGSGETVQ